MTNSLFDRYTPQVAEEVQRLHMFLQEMNIYLVVANQGYSVKVIDAARGRPLSLEAAVSLYNKGEDSFAFRELTDFQKAQAQVSVSERGQYAPLTLQRCRGILVTEKCLRTVDCFRAVALYKERREILKS